jgi:excisionase family DNA binding protein
MTSEFVTIDQVQDLLGVSRSTVWRLIQGGNLPSVRREARRLVPVKAVTRRAQDRRTDNLPLFSERHPIFRLAGAGRSGGRTPGARDKHAILAE